MERDFSYERIVLSTQKKAFSGFYDPPLSIFIMGEFLNIKIRVWGRSFQKHFCKQGSNDSALQRSNFSQEAFELRNHMLLVPSLLRL